MQFNSYVFILAFLPLMVLAYFLLGKINRILGKVVLIAGSIFFYAYTDITTLKVLLLSIIINYLFVKLIDKTELKKIFMAIPVVVNIILLLYYKYTDFAITNINILFGTEYKLWDIILTLGISFFTFQQIAYVVAVFRKEIATVRFIDYVTYILYFPKLLMGPLMDPVDFICQLNNDELKKFSPDNVACGIKIFSFGLLKKVLIADTFAKAVSWGFDNIETASAVELILVMLFYTFEIYFDFSGYSDMAVGVSKMFNITLPINFDSPYKAASIRDFWKRWHISLTKFLTKYIYIPLGGSRKGELFTYINTMIVFIVSGIWHGANWTFILWGFIHGVFMVIDRLIEKIPNPKGILKHERGLFTFALVNVLWLLFRADTVSQWIGMLKTMVSFESTVISDGLIEIFNIPESSVIFNSISFLAKLNGSIHGFTMYFFIFIACVVCFIPENNYKKLNRLSFVGMIISAVAFIWGVTCLGSESVFVYFNF